MTSACAASRGRNWTPDSTEMAEASGQDWVEQDCGAAVLPRAGAVPPPCQCARHGTAYPPDRVELVRRLVRSQPTSCRWTFADPSRRSLSRGHPDGWSRVTVVSLL